MTIRRPLIFLAAVGSALASCGAPPHVDPSTPFTEQLIARLDAPPVATTPAPPASSVDVRAPAGASTVARSRDDETRGLIEPSPAVAAELQRVAGNDDALTRLLQDPIRSEDLAYLAVLRSPAVAEARGAYQAARTSLAQSADLDDLLAVYRGFRRDLDARVGPSRDRTTAMIAPSPNVSGLSAEVAHRTAEIAFARLRGVVRDVVADAWIAHADAARLAQARAIVAEEVESDQGLLEVFLARLESGSGTQSGYLALQARLAHLRAELDILAEQESALRARWNRLLSRDGDASASLRTATESVDPIAIDDDRVVALALARRPELTMARLAAERSDLALRLAETMTLPRLDLGSARLEQDGEFRDRGRVMPARADFGVREAQVDEMRQRASAAHASLESMRDRVRAETHQALFENDAARRRLRAFDDDSVPLLTRALEAARGAYEGGQTGYLDVLDAVTRLLEARLGRADAKRDLVHARSKLLQAVGASVDIASSGDNPP